MVNLFRAFLYPRWPYIVPPGTPKEVVGILRGAMAKAFKDPEFHKEFKKLMTNDPTPLTGEEMEVAIRELPRDPEDRDYLYDPDSGVVRYRGSLVLGR